MKKINITVIHFYLLLPKNNIEIAKLLIEYANKNDIVLEINEKSKNGENPIFLSIDHNNIKMFKLLVEYSVEKKIKLIINEKDIEEIISKNLNFVNLKKISEINFEFIKLIYLYKNKNIIEVVFSENSYILKKFIEYLENEKERIEKDLENEKREKEKIENDLENEKREKEKIENDLENEKRKNMRIENENKIIRKFIMNRKNTKKDDKDTFITYECQQGNIEKVKKLIHRGMDINEKNKDGDTPLLIACRNNNIELVKCLLNYKEV